MLSRIFPKQIDNIFRGHRLAIWLFLPIVLVELVIGANSMVNTRSVATSADGIPLDAFTSGGAAAVVSLFALLGLCRLLFALQGVLVLIRYRALIPFMYLLLLILQLGSRALLLVNPIARSDASSAQIGSGVILALLAMLVVGFVLSLLKTGAPGRGGPV
jgi:hypothetical protein